METVIIYENYNGEIFDKKDIQKFRDFNVIYMKNDSVKMIEHYGLSSIERYTYYLDENENIENVLRKYSGQYIDIINITYLGQYKIEESLIYDMDKIYLNTKTLFDESNNYVCEQPLNTVTKNPILNKTEKFFRDILKDKYFSFTYDEIGSINEVLGDFFDHNRPVNRNNFLLLFPNFLVENPYYENTTFLPTI